MERFLWICVGGAFGSGARYLLSGWVQESLGAQFPWGTLAVNVVGSFLIALVMQLAISTGQVSPLLRMTLTTGVIGGFTTYSAFNYETFALMQQRAWLLANANVAATLVLCMLAGYLGQASAKWMASG